MKNATDDWGTYTLPNNDVPQVGFLKSWNLSPVDEIGVRWIECALLYIALTNSGSQRRWATVSEFWKAMYLPSAASAARLLPSAKP